MGSSSCVWCVSTALRGGAWCCRLACSWPLCPCLVLGVAPLFLEEGSPQGSALCPGMGQQPRLWPSQDGCVPWSPLPSCPILEGSLQLRGGVLTHRPVREDL